MGKVLKMASHTDDGTKWSVEDMINHALEQHKTKHPNIKKAIVILLDDNDGSYDTAFYQSGMKMSEMTAALEVVKAHCINIIIDKE